MNKSIKSIGTILQYIISISLIISGTLKIIGLDVYIDVIIELSPEYYNHIILLGVIAIATGCLLLIPKTFVFGIFSSFVFLGGTISAHMQHGDSYIPQIIFALLTGTAALLKRPEWFSEQSN